METNRKVRFVQKIQWSFHQIGVGSAVVIVVSVECSTSYIFDHGIFKCCGKMNHGYLQMHVKCCLIVSSF